MAARDVRGSVCGRNADGPLVHLVDRFSLQERSSPAAKKGISSFGRFANFARTRPGSAAMQPPVIPTEPEPQATSEKLLRRTRTGRTTGWIFRASRQSLQIRKIQVESVVQLLDEGNTIPFITRYRKERTGGLQEDVLRLIRRGSPFAPTHRSRRRTILCAALKARASSPTI